MCSSPLVQMPTAAPTPRTAQITADALLTCNEVEYFYEREAEYFGFTPFQLLDEIGEIVVKVAFEMFDHCPARLGTSFLKPHQLETVTTSGAFLIQFLVGNWTMVSVGGD